MLGGLVSWVTTDLLRATGALAPRGTAHQERDTTDGCSTAPAEATAQTLHVWRPDGSMGTGIVNGRLGAAWGVWGRGSLWACGGVEDSPRGGNARSGSARARSPCPEADVLTCTRPGARAANHRRMHRCDGHGLPVRHARATSRWWQPMPRP